MRLAHALLTVGLSASALPFLAGPVSAAPEQETIPLTCADGQSFDVVVNGNGEFTPARDLDTTRVLVPHAFGPFHGEVRDAQGVLVDSFDEDGVVKGSGKQKTDITCTFTFHEVSDGSDPEFPAGYTFHGSGTVIGKLTGR